MDSAFQSAGNADDSRRPALSDQDKSLIFRAAGRRVAAAVCRKPAESTGVLLGHIATQPVYGAFVTLKRRGRLRSCCGHIERGCQLAVALDHAADRAATDDPRFPPIEPGELPQLDMDVWILWGPEQVTARGDDRIKAVVIGRHGLLIARGRARGLLLPGVAVEHNLDALAFLEQVCIKAGLPTDAWRDDDTQLWIFEGESIHGRLMSDEPTVRPPAAAGGFYPAGDRQVRNAVAELFADLPSVEPEYWPGAMVPHAGWKYSGRLAAAVFSRLKIPRQTIILCPRHRPYGARWAVAPHEKWLFPGGELLSDPELAAQLAQGIAGLELDAAAHRDEHAIEVQLPLLARIDPNVRVVGIAVGQASLEELLRFGHQLAGVIDPMPERPLLIVSTDMNHFEDEQYTRRVDRMALDAIETLDPAKVYETVRRNQISMCGLGPCVIVMEALRSLGRLTHCELVGYTTSAEASGDVDRVVGYAGMLFG